MKVKCKPTRTPDIGLPALREKYRQERDKRIRREGQKQYVEAADEFADNYEADPYTPAVVRASDLGRYRRHHPRRRLCRPHGRLPLEASRRHQFPHHRYGGDFGGVWYWNRYPGIQCDNESYCYLPLLEEVGFMPKKNIADGREIHEHCQRFGHFGLYESALFAPLISALRWDGTIKRWRVGTNRGDDIRARFVIMLRRPQHAEAAGHSRHRELQGEYFPHGALGL